MATKIRTIGILLFVAMATTFSKCEKVGFGCADVAYQFDLSMRAYPDNSIVPLGDTIWLEVSSPNIFIDIPSGKEVVYSGAANLGTAIGFGKFYDQDSVKDAADQFDFYLVNGTKVEKNPFTSKIREYLFVEENNNYLFKLGIIPKEDGIYGIGLSNAANVNRKSDKCTRALFIINFGQTEQHYFLNSYINHPSDIDTTKPSGSYFFEVK